MTTIRQFYLSELFISSKASWRLTPKPEIIELAKRIQRDGLLSPLLIRANVGRYEVIDGEKRFKAIMLLMRKKLLPRSLNKIPCYFESTGINNQKESTYKPLLLTDSDFASRVNSMADKGHNEKHIVAYFDCSVAAVNDAMSIRKLHPSMKNIFDNGNITLRQASAFATLPNPQSQYDLLVQLGPFVSTKTIIAAVKQGETVLSLPDGNIIILPSRSKKSISTPIDASLIDAESSNQSIKLAA